MNHQLTAPVATPARQDGALAGFEVRCSCGFVATNTVRSNVEQDGRDHVAWAAKVGR